jgi:hypothetical protein
MTDLHLLLRPRQSMDLVTDQVTFQWVHPTQDNWFNPSIDNNVIHRSCSGEEAEFVWRACCVRTRAKMFTTRSFRGSPIFQEGPWLLALRDVNSKNVSNRKQNRQRMTWVISTRPSDAGHPLLSRRSATETTDFWTIQTAKEWHEGTPTVARRTA